MSWSLQSQRFANVIAFPWINFRNSIKICQLIQNPESRALDCVTCDEAEEFSQLHLGEQIVDYVVMEEGQMLTQFDRDNDYLARWTKEEKIDYVRNWMRREL